PARVPPAVELVLGGTTRRWEIPHPTTDLESRPASTIALALDARRGTIYDSLWKELRDATAAERTAAIATLRSLVGGEGTPRATHRSLTPEELRRLAADPLIEVGAHTASHPRLGALPPAEQRREIDEGRRTLESLTGARVASFAYPFGRAGDYTDQTMQLVRESGFARACSNRTGRVDRSADRFALPRLYVRDWDRDQFAAVLRQHGVHV
ncbi:MAG TPA: polysaccharide deacetylase family protein, partial [Gemmatimonadaceae bacterium]|nr:polysaccharide deacetylase family protein [Gemmatimonadaceae bacterium]